MFLTELEMICIPRTNTYQVAKTFIYKQTCIPLSEYHRICGLENIYVIPGFRTDFASIPRLFWNIISPESPGIREASVIHDYLYSSRTIYTRQECDEILRCAMIESGANPIMARIVYFAVRLFGWSHWRESTDITRFDIDYPFWRKNENK